MFEGDGGGLEGAERALDRVEADLAVARGRLIHARFVLGSVHERIPLKAEQEHAEEELELFERAVRLYRAVGDLRGEGEGLFWVGVFHQVVRRDQETARPLFERSRELAERAGDRLTLSYAVRHLGILEHFAGRLPAARELLEESVRLRKAIGFSAGVAANLVGLAHIALDEGRRGEAVALLDEAEEIFGQVGEDKAGEDKAKARGASWYVASDGDAGVDGDAGGDEPPVSGLGVAGAIREARQRL